MLTDGFISFEEFVDFVFSTGDKDFLSDADLEKVRQLSTRGFKEEKREKEGQSRENSPQLSQTSPDSKSEELEMLKNRVEELQLQLQRRDEVVRDLMAQLKKAQKDLESAQSGQDSKDAQISCHEREEFQDEIVQLKKQLHEKHFCLQRLENQQEKTVEGYATFVKALLKSSARLASTR